MLGIINAIQDYFLENYGQWLFVVGVLVVGYFAIKVVDRYLDRFFAKLKVDKTLEIFIQKTIKVLLWLILLILILANLGFDVSAFIAGLGVIGFIVGFATKDVLANLTAGLFILITQPLKVGESVVVAGIQGKVKAISISSCILVTEQNEYVIIPNSQAWGGPIKNLSRLREEK